MNQKEINRTKKVALEKFHSGDLKAAEHYSIILLQNIRNDYKSWELLGVIQMKLLKYPEALEALNKATNLTDKDESPYINMAILKKRLGHVEESIHEYKKALTINSNSPVAHNNLANLYRELKRFNEAERHAKEAISLDTNYVAAYSNLGLIQYELGNIDDARKNCEKALQINPQFAEAYNNLGTIFVEMGDFHSAKKSYENAVKLDDNLTEAKVNLGGVLFNLNEVSASKEILTSVIRNTPDNLYAKLGLAQIAITQNQIQEGVDLYKKIVEKNEDIVGPKARLALAIQAYIYQNFPYCADQLYKSKSILEISKIAYRNEAMYARYLYQLLEWRKSNQVEEVQKGDQILLVIGESHALATVGMKPFLKGRQRFCQVRWIEGCKQWTLGLKEKNIWNQKLELICNTINEPVDILFTIGEIDCRYNQGIMKLSEKNPNKSLDETIDQTITRFLDVITKLFKNKSKSIIIQGVPYPKMTFELNDPRRDKHLKIINDFNVCLKAKSHSLGYGFLDVYEMTRPHHGVLQEQWHIDDVHLRPNYIIEAFKNYLSF